MGYPLIDIAQGFIIKGEINNTFWLKIILAMTYIMNIRLLCTLNSFSLHKKLYNTLLDLPHFQELAAMIFIFMYEEEKILKSENFVL